MAIILKGIRRNSSPSAKPSSSFKYIPPGATRGTQRTSTGKRLGKCPLTHRTFSVSSVTWSSFNLCEWKTGKVKIHSLRRFLVLVLVKPLGRTTFQMTPGKCLSISHFYQMKTGKVHLLSLYFVLDVVRPIPTITPNQTSQIGTLVFSWPSVM